MSLGQRVALQFGLRHIRPLGVWQLHTTHPLWVRYKKRPLPVGRGVARMYLSRRSLHLAEFALDGAFLLRTLVAVGTRGRARVDRLADLLHRLVQPVDAATDGLDWF
jgi:hypothetical protein